MLTLPFIFLPLLACLTPQMIPFFSYHFLLFNLALPSLLFSKSWDGEKLTCNPFPLSTRRWKSPRRACTTGTLDRSGRRRLRRHERRWRVSSQPGFHVMVRGDGQESDDDALWDEWHGEERPSPPRQHKHLVDSTKNNTVDQLTLCKAR